MTRQLTCPRCEHTETAKERREHNAIISWFVEFKLTEEVVEYPTGDDEPIGWLLTYQCPRCGYYTLDYVANVNHGEPDDQNAV